MSRLSFHLWRSQSRHSSTSRPLQVAGSFRRTESQEVSITQPTCALLEKSQKKNERRNREKRETFRFEDFQRFKGLEVHCVGPPELPRGKGHSLMADVLGWKTSQTSQVTSGVMFLAFSFVQRWIEMRCMHTIMYSHICITCRQASSLTSCTSWNTCSSKN